MISNARAEPLRLKVLDFNRRQVEATGAQHFMTSYGRCRLQFDSGTAATGWERGIESLIELVRDQIA